MLTPLSAVISEDSPAQDAKERHVGSSGGRLASPECGEYWGSIGASSNSSFDMGVVDAMIGLRGLFGFEL